MEDPLVRGLRRRAELFKRFVDMIDRMTQYLTVGV